LDAVRILGLFATNPIFVLLDGKPIRGRSRVLGGALRCRPVLDQKAPKISRRNSAAQAAYDHAREVYANSPRNAQNS